MKNSSLKALLVSSFFLFALLPLAGQEKKTQPEAAPQYSLGDQTFAINLGPMIPLFFLSYAPAVTSTNLFPIGGFGSLQWQAYLSPQIRLGLEGGGMFTFSPNVNPLLMATLSAKMSYIFTLYPFEIPISLNLGVDFVKYQDQSIVDPLIKPGISFYWIFNSSWSFGLNVAYWLDFQFATNPAQSRVGNFLEISLSALSHL